MTDRELDALLRYALLDAGAEDWAKETEQPEAESRRQRRRMRAMLADPRGYARRASRSLGRRVLRAAACLALAQGAHALGKQVWAYTGYTLEELRAMEDPAVQGLLQEADVLVDGPYLEAQRSLELKFRGSKNQRLIDLKKTGDGPAVLWQDPWDNL